MTPSEPVLRLQDVAILVRSKNAGPFELTFDVLFDDSRVYETVRDTGLLSPEVFASLYPVPPASVDVIHYDPGLAIKATIPRPTPAGSPADGDVMGGQQYVPLAELVLPQATVERLPRDRRQPRI